MPDGVAVGLARLLRACGLLVCLLPGKAWADFDARVVRVLDGDSVIVVRDNAQRVRVRLASIDAPERAQPYGERAQDALAALVLNRQVTVIEQGTGRQGTVIGVLMQGETNVNQQLVRDGMAWAFRKYLADSTLMPLETAARRARRGLWADPQPQSPWDFRREQHAAAQVERAHGGSEDN